MKTIYDHQLYAELKKDLSWETLFDDDYCLKNSNIPILSGGLDHISKTKKYFVFHDIGCNGRDNSFRIGDVSTMKQTRIYPTATTDHPDYGDDAPLYEYIRVFFDHVNYQLSDINNISDAILAMDIDHGMDCGFSASDVLHEIKDDPSISYAPSLKSIFLPLANDLVRLGMLCNTGYLVVETEYVGLLSSVGVSRS